MSRCPACPITTVVGMDAFITLGRGPVADPEWRVAGRFSGLGFPQALRR